MSCNEQSREADQQASEIRIGEAHSSSALKAIREVAIEDRCDLGPDELWR